MANDAPSPALPRSSNLDPVDDQRQCGWREGAWSAILFWGWSGGVSSQCVWLLSARWLGTAWYKPDKISKKSTLKEKKNCEQHSKKKKKSESMKYDATQRMHRKSQILDDIFNIIVQVYWLLHCHVGLHDQFALHFISLMHFDFTYALLIKGPSSACIRSSSSQQQRATFLAIMKVSFDSSQCQRAENFERSLNSVLLRLCASKLFRPRTLRMWSNQLLQIKKGAWLQKSFCWTDKYVGTMDCWPPAVESYHRGDVYAGGGGGGSVGCYAVAYACSCAASLLLCFCCWWSDCCTD